MASADVKRTASIYINDVDAQRGLKRLQEEAKHLVTRLEQVPHGSKDFKDISTRLVQVQRNMRALANDTREQEGWFKRITGSLGPLGGAIAGFFAFDAVKRGMGASVEAYREHDLAVAKVETSLQNAGRTAGVTFNEIAADATRLQENSLFSDEDVMSKASTSLLNFGNIAGDNFMRAQQVAVDLSTTMDGDLQAAALAVGKALNSPTQGLTALQRMGVRFTDDQKAVIKALVDTGKAGEAQGMILAELEKRFAGQAKAQAEAEGGYHKLHVAVDELAEGLGSGLSAAFSELAGGLADAINGAAEWLGLTNKQSDAVALQRVEMNSLFNVLRDGNITQEQRADLVKRINKEYGEFLPKSISITDSETELAAAQKATNAAMLDRIMLLAKQELLQDAQKDAVDAQKLVLETELKLENARQGQITTLDRLKFGLVTNEQAVLTFERRLTMAKDASDETTAALDELTKSLGDVSGGMKGADGEGAAIGATVEDPEEVDKKTEAVRKVLSDARERLRTDSMKGAEKEIVEVADKYWKMAQQAEGSAVGLEEIEELKGQEIAAIRRKYGEKEVEEMRKLDEQIADLRMAAAARDGDDGGAAVAAVRMKYAALLQEAKGNAQRELELQQQMDAELAAARTEGIKAQRQQELDLELDKVADKYAKLEEGAKGHASRLAALEELKEQEVRAVRQRFAEEDQRAVEDVRASEEDERVAALERKLAGMQADYEAEVEQRKQNEQGYEDLDAEFQERRAEIDAELRQAQKDVINQHFEELYEQADAAGVSTENLQKLHGEAIHAIDEEAARTQVKLTKEKNAAIIDSEKKRNAAVKAVALDLLDAFDVVFTAAAGDAKEAEDFHKAITLVKIGVDTASAISGIVSAAASSSITPIDLAIKVAAGTAIVLTNIGKAIDLMSKDTPEPPKFAVGGGTDVAPNISLGGAVRTPTLGLFGEAGPEWVAPNWMYEHPTLTPLFGQLENIRTIGAVPRFAEGGHTTRRDRAGAGTGYTFTGGTGAHDNGPDWSQMDMPQLREAIEQLNGHLARGIRATTSYDQQREDDKRMNDIRIGAERAR